MAKILATLKNASELINGVKFVEHELGKISEEVSDEIAALFANVPGFEVVVEKVKEAKAKASKADASAAPAPAAAPATAAPAQS